MKSIEAIAISSLFGHQVGVHGIFPAPRFTYLYPAAHYVNLKMVWLLTRVRPDQETPKKPNRGSVRAEEKAAVERIWRKQDSKVQILAMAFT